MADRSPLPELADEVLRLSARMQAATALFGDDAGLSGAQLLVLTAVARAKTPPTVPQIARSLGHSRQAIQRQADVLVAAGMVELVDNPDHKRARRLVATDRGANAYGRADEKSRSWEVGVVAGIPPGDLATAVITLRRLRARLEQQLANDSSPLDHAV